MPIAFVPEWDGSESKCELWEKGCCMNWELVVNDMWRGCLLSSRNTSNLQFLACSCLSKLKWCIWRIIALFHLCCHYEEILNYKHNTICNIIPFASLRTQKRWVNIRWLLGPQQWFYIKNSDRTTHSGVSPFPISLSLVASHFLSDTDTMPALSVNGLMWPFSMMDTFSDLGGIFTSMVVLENVPILWN